MLIRVLDGCKYHVDGLVTVQPIRIANFVVKWAYASKTLLTTFNILKFRFLNCRNQKGQGKYVLVYTNSGEVLSKLESRGFRATT